MLPAELSEFTLADKKRQHILSQALNEVLCCPNCYGNLEGARNASLICQQCAKQFPITHGIVRLIAEGNIDHQKDERVVRRDVANEHRGRTADEILSVVGQHHALLLMHRKAELFRKRFSQNDWIMDIGCGTGHYWRNTVGGNLLLVDFVFENLEIARLLLGNTDRVIFVQADATKLPVRSHSVTAAWSVQVTQHFAASVMDRFSAEMSRVLKENFDILFINLNPAPLHKVIYKVFGKSGGFQGRMKQVHLAKFGSKELIKMWKRVFQGQISIACRYSELFFHPDLHIKLDNGFFNYLDHLLGKFRIASLFARQIQIEITRFV